MNNYLGSVKGSIKKLTIRHWVVVAVCNLLLVALLGLLMRLKVLFPLPLINQKHVLHAHSHFAFSGWITHILMVLIIAAILKRKSHEVLPAKYQYIIIANLIAAYGMLVSFFLQGYGLYSICIATLSIVVSYWFVGVCWRDLHQTIERKNGFNWFRAALVFLAISSLGTFALAYLMATHNTNSRLQLASIYFYLHFQYNGWFFFACMGLLQNWLYHKGVFIKYAKTVFWTLSLTCVPAYLLSILWQPMPQAVYLFVVLTAIVQVLVWALWCKTVYEKLGPIRLQLAPISRWLLGGVAIAVSIKFLLQSLSVIPSLSQLAYSFRPIVIGYLHLVLLVIITLFIIAYAYTQRSLRTNRMAIASTWAFVCGVVLNELLLTLQGASGMMRVYINHIPLALGVAALIMAFSLIGLLWSQISNQKTISTISTA